MLFSWTVLTAGFVATLSPHMVELPFTPMSDLPFTASPFAVLVSTLAVPLLLFVPFTIPPLALLAPHCLTATQFPKPEVVLKDIKQVSLVLPPVHLVPAGSWTSTDIN